MSVPFPNNDRLFCATRAGSGAVLFARSTANVLRRVEADKAWCQWGKKDAFLNKDGWTCGFPKVVMFDFWGSAGASKNFCQWISPNPLIHIQIQYLDPIYQLSNIYIHIYIYEYEVNMCIHRSDFRHNYIDSLSSCITFHKCYTVILNSLNKSSHQFIHARCREIHRRCDRCMGCSPLEWLGASVDPMAWNSVDPRMGCRFLYTNTG